MINGERVIALIPVRGGSKGLPRKNEKLLGDHPLMAWAIKCANSCPSIDRVIVSTEDPKLKEIGQEYGAEHYPRADKLATDKAGVYDVIMDLKETLKKEGETAKYMVLLEATSPFRSVEMIEEALKLLTLGHNSVATFKKAHTHPFQTWKIEDGKISTFIPEVNPWVTRQELPPAYELTGEVYAFELELLKKDSKSLLVGKQGSIIVKTSVDINNDKDFDFAEKHFANFLETHPI